jgi:hypothetical protein
VCGQRHAPAALLQGKRPGTYCTRGWVGPVRTGTENHAPHQDFEPRTVQPVASRCTDHAVPAAMFCVHTNARQARYTASHVGHRQHVELDCVTGGQLTQCTAQVAVGLAVDFAVFICYIR